MSKCYASMRAKESAKRHGKKNSIILNKNLTAKAQSHIVA